MTTVRELHNRSAELAQLALVARHNGEADRAIHLARTAYQLEAEAADLVPEGRQSEPTRSVLFRSAASLAFQCRDYDAAIRLIAKALTGHPPAEVEDELRSLYEQVTFEQDLRKDKLTLTDSGLDVVLKGPAVGFGHIRFEEFMERMQLLKTIVDRWIQRKLGREYQSGGRVAAIYRPYVPVIQAVRAGSFAVTIKFGVSENQQMTFLAEPTDVIDELVTGFALLNEGDLPALRELIPNAQYYVSFITLARQMAPDGERITSLTLSSPKQTIGFTRKRSEVEVPKQETAAAPKAATEAVPQRLMRAIEVEGEIDLAIGREENAVELTTDQGEVYRIRVGEGTDDLVRTFWGRVVKVTGTTDGQIIYPTDFTPI
jgi:hypothetical protein